MRVVLDTSAYSHFKGGRPSIVRRVDSATWIGMPTIVLGELEVGFRLGRRRDENLDELESFLAHPAVEVIDGDRDVASLYGEIVFELRRKGTPIPTNDIWIAACTARFGGTLLTYDRHYELVDRIGVLLLEPD